MGILLADIFELFPVFLRNTELHLNHEVLVRQGYRKRDWQNIQLAACAHCQRRVLAVLLQIVSELLKHNFPRCAIE